MTPDVTSEKTAVQNIISFHTLFGYTYVYMYVCIYV